MPNALHIMPTHPLIAAAQALLDKFGGDTPDWLETEAQGLQDAIAAAVGVPEVEAEPVPTFTYSRWRHGGWYVHGVRYPSGAVGCVAKGTDGRWVIVCDSHRNSRTFASRGEAALAEYYLAKATPTEKA